MLDALRRRSAGALKEFLALESTGGLLLVGAAVLALVAANSPLRAGYEAALGLRLTVKLGTFGVDKPLLLWINDGLMAVFFLVVALELKRELAGGHLSDRRQVALPAACALGGMLLPMGLYLWLNAADPEARAGFAIPAATDIAFALGVLSLLGPRVPVGLKVLLTAIAVLDDLGAIVIIALFYSGGLAWQALAAGGAALVGLVLLNRRGVVQWVPYVVLGGVLWVAVLKSGIHATLAGVALGATIPLTDARNPEHSPLEEVEHALHPWIAYGVLPVFAFANAGIPLAGLSLADLVEPVPLGIALGLLIGKPLGVLAPAVLLVRTGLAQLPEGVGWLALAGMAGLCGIGFTMSFFVGALAFGEPTSPYHVTHRVGILAASALAAGVGWTLLFLATRARQPSHRGCGPPGNQDPPRKTDAL